MTAIVDFHSHLMPAVDDGAPDATHSLDALRAFAAQGIGTCITTPHFEGSLTRSPAAFAGRIAEIDAGWERLRAVVASAASAPGSGDGARDAQGTAAASALPKVERGVEVMLDDPDPDLSDSRLRLAGGPYVLCEFPAMRLPPNAEWAMQNLIRKGWRPIIAHPERYRNHDDRLTALVRCREAGAHLQVNAGSFLGQHGDTARAIARKLLELGWVDYIASDFHARGTPATARAVALLIERGGEVQARRLTEENPARILTGEPPLTVPPFVAPKTGPVSWWSRLFRR